MRPVHEVKVYHVLRSRIIPMKQYSRSEGEGERRYCSMQGALPGTFIYKAFTMS